MTRVCVYCGTTFAPHGRQKQCRAPECERKRTLETGARWRTRNPERYRQVAREQGRRRMERRRADPEYRQREIERERARYVRRREAGESSFRIATKEEYERMFAEQEGVCAICLRPETTKDGSGRTRRLAVDHDADTGKVRGLLCQRCNMGVGLLLHSDGNLLRAVDYLTKAKFGDALAVLDEAVRG
jgi:hypothetical protein